MPHPEMAGMKQKGRVYVCDLAGTEPAGDIVFAKYEKKVFPNGDIEHKYLGAHEDDRKTKELQVLCVQARPWLRGKGCRGTEVGGLCRAHVHRTAGQS